MWNGSRCWLHAGGKSLGGSSSVQGSHGHGKPGKLVILNDY